MRVGVLVADQACAGWKKEWQHIKALFEEYNIYPITKGDAWKEITCSERLRIITALICIDFPNALELAQHIYAANPFCYIIFYGKGRRDIIPFLSSRPIHYVDILEDRDAALRYINVTWQRIRQENNYFHYEDRFRVEHRPYSQILYFLTRDRMLYYQTLYAEHGPFRLKLDDLEDKLAQGAFLRCHKSFLVNKEACVVFNKSTNQIKLINGETINVSRSHETAVKTYFADLSI